MIAARDPNRGVVVDLGGQRLPAPNFAERTKARAIVLKKKSTRPTRSTMRITAKYRAAPRRSTGGDVRCGAER